MNSTLEQWFTNMSPDFEAGIRLFCFPNAGGGTMMFRDWSRHLRPDIGVTPVLFPGQGSRLRELPPTRIEMLIDEMRFVIEPYLDEPFAFFGYSMGALVAFELARALRRHHLPGPTALIVGARRAPQFPDPAVPLHNRPDAQFIQGLQARYGGIPPEILKDADMLAAFTPVLRANFAMIETYEYHEEAPFDFPIAAFGGTQDRSANEEDFAGWGHHTTQTFTFQMFEGNHFFIQQYQNAVITRINEILKRT